MDYIFREHFTVTAFRFLFSELQIPSLRVFIIQPITDYQNMCHCLHQDQSLSEFTIVYCRRRKECSVDTIKVVESRFGGFYTRPTRRKWKFSFAYHKLTCLENLSDKVVRLFLR